MKKAILFFLWSIFFYNYIAAQIVINEVAPTNTGYYLDEDEDASDWIELYNVGTTAINIGGWGLSDDVNKKWLLPDLLLPAGQRLMVFASGKDRGELAIPMATVNHWETAIYEDDEWRYFAGTSQPLAAWNTVAFNDAIWESGQGGFGYGDGDDNTVVASGTASVYYRKTFEVINVADVVKAIVSMDYDDAFIAYMNGVEVARAGISGTPNYNTLADTDHEAQMYDGGDPQGFMVDNATLSSLLVEGTNVLAIELHNIESTSSDLSGRSWLHIGVASTNTYYGTNPTWFVGDVGASSYLHTNFKLSIYESLKLYNALGVLQDSTSMVGLQPEHTRTRIPDAGNWCYTDIPTPDATNAGTCYTSYAMPPSFSLAAGFYNGAQSSSLSGGDNIRYTIDGNVPALSSNLYNQPITINNSMTIRARRFEAGKLPSETITSSYLIDEPTQLPVVCITAQPSDLFNGYGGDAWYDNAPYGGGAPKVGCYVSYFDANKEFKFGENASFAVVGNFSTAFNQKPMQFQFDEDWGAKGDVINAIFAADKPDIATLKGFRVRNMDDDYADARMRDVIANRMSKGTHSAWAAYQNVAVFINGEYWGHYAAREILNEDYCHNNYGSNVDNIDLLKTRIYYPLEVAAGSNADFLDLYNFITSNDMSNTANYDSILTRLDVPNMVDYFANEIFNDNEDWFPSNWYNNTELFASRNPTVTWKYIQWDQAYGMYNCGFNLLDEVINDPNDSYHSQIFNALMTNTSFKHYFVNRFADLLNTHFKASNVNQLITENANEISSEITPNYNRWNGSSPNPPDFNTWEYQVQTLKDFYTCRVPQQRNHLVNSLDLDGQVTITLQANPVEAGFIKISTIIPPSYPWSGVYFKGSPVTVTAIAAPGYTFTNWSTNGFIVDANSPTFTQNITNNTTFTANFAGNSVSNAITISELNYNSDSTRTSGDWVELHNTANVAVNVSDYVLQDEHFYNRYTLPTGTTIPANGYLVLAENQHKFYNIHPAVNNVIGNLGFDFDNSGDSLTLTNYLGTIAQVFRYNDEMPWAQCADGKGRTLEALTTATDLNTPTSWFDGCMFGSAGIYYSPCQNGVILNEINYKSAISADAGDWIELYNADTVAIDLSSWKLTDDNNTSEFLIPDGTIIPPQGYWVIYGNLLKFNNIHPDVINKTGAFTFGLSGDGEVIRLYDNSGTLYLSMFYNDAAPWPLTPDGGGTTLELISPTNDLNIGTSWQASCGNGTPAMPNSNGTSLNLSIAGSLTVCNNGLQTYTVPAVLGSTYNWTVTNGTIIAGQNTNAIVVQWDSNTTGTVNLVQTSP